MKIFNKIPSEKPKSKLLCNIDSPSDYRSFSSQELELLADELREYLLYSVGQSGGHLEMKMIYSHWENQYYIKVQI